MGKYDLKPLLICIEGLDKSGKTTQARLLVEELKRRGFRSVYTSEPTSGEIGQLLRETVLRRRRRIPAVVEAVLFAADRLYHVEREIKPFLRRGFIVVSDRYLYSSLAYQGAAGLDLQWIRRINRFSPKPDIAIYLDVPLEILASRMDSEGSVMENIENQVRVRDVYMRIVEDGELILVDGKGSIKDTSNKILSLVLERIEG